jgi:NADH-quinone oxidoreductase subunit K
MNITVIILLFVIAVILLIIKKNFIFLLISLELLGLAVNLSFILFSLQLDDFHGQVVSLFLLSIAAADSALGLALLLSFYRLRGSISVLYVNLKG